jgi:hypothetical protein
MVHSAFGLLSQTSRCIMAYSPFFPSYPQPIRHRGPWLAASPCAHRRSRTVRFARTQGPAWHFGESKSNHYPSRTYNSPNNSPFGESSLPFKADERRYAFPAARLVERGGRAAFTVPQEREWRTSRFPNRSLSRGAWFPLYLPRPHSCPIFRQRNIPTQAESPYSPHPARSSG